MRVMVIGGAGLLGTAVVRRLQSDGIEPVCLSRRTVPSLNICAPELLARSLAHYDPDWVVLAAAAADVDGVEADPDRAFRVNALGARNTAEECKSRSIGLTYISTDFVFDGTLGRPYSEFDTPHPLSVYGRSKLAGEQFVTQAGAGFQIVRLSYLYGPDGPCFPGRVLSAGAAGQPLRLIRDTCISPTSTRQAARLIVRLLRQRRSGIYHVAGAGHTSPLAFGLRLLTAAGLPTEAIQPIDASEWVAPAQRPAYSALRPYVLDLEGANDLEPWEDEADEFARTWMCASGKTIL